MSCPHPSPTPSSGPGVASTRALPTAVLGVATASGIQASDAFGTTGTRTARVDDHHRLFSATKPLVGLAVARMIEAGLLGARDFAAGSASRYSTIAYEGVARMIQKRTARTWDAAVADVFAPVGATRLTLDEASNPHHIVDAADAGFDLQRFSALRHPVAGLIGRAEDLLQIGGALIRDAREIVRPTTRDDASTAHRGRPAAGSIYRRTRAGLGLQLESAHAPGLIDRDVYGHGGRSGTEFWIHPTVGVASVLLTNRENRPGVELDELDNAVVSRI